MRCGTADQALRWIAGRRGVVALEFQPGPWEPGWIGVGCVTGSTSRNSLKVQYVDDICLDKLSVKELRELKEKIELAVRAAIRERNKPKLVASNPAMVAPAKPIDLESEARAWMAARRK